jgi:hypothetical protein
MFFDYENEDDDEDDLIKIAAQKKYLSSVFCPLSSVF